MALISGGINQTLSPIEQEEGEKVLRKLLKENAERKVNTEGLGALAQILKPGLDQKEQEEQQKKNGGKKDSGTVNGQQIETSDRSFEEQLEFHPFGNIYQTQQDIAKFMLEKSAELESRPGEIDMERLSRMVGAQVGGKASEAEMKGFLEEAKKFKGELGRGDVRMVPASTPLSLGGLRRDESGNLVREEPGFIWKFMSLARTGSLTFGQPSQKELLRTKQRGATTLSRYLEDRKDKREVIKAALKKGGTGNEAAIVGADTTDFIQAWNDVTLKGYWGGKVGAIGGAVGFQRGERDAFKSLGSKLAFSYAAFVLGQKGRAFTDNERKEIQRNIIAVSLVQTEGQFKAKMDAIITSINNRIANTSSLSDPEFLPNYDMLQKQLKQTQRGAQTTSGVKRIQGEIEEINKRLDNLGGR